MTTPRAVLVGSLLIALSILAVGFFAIRSNQGRYQYVAWSEGPRFVRVDTFTGATLTCRTTGLGRALDCSAGE